VAPEWSVDRKASETIDFEVSDRHIDGLCRTEVAPILRRLRHLRRSQLHRATARTSRQPDGPYG